MDKELIKEIRTALKKTREYLGISQRQAAAAMGVTHQNLSIFENSDRPPSMSTLARAVQFYFEHKRADMPDLLEQKLKRNYLSLTPELKRFFWMFLAVCAMPEANQAVEPAKPVPGHTDSPNTELPASE